MIVFKVSYDQGGGDKSCGARFGPMAIERMFHRYPWRGAEDGTPHPHIHWADEATSLEDYRRMVGSTLIRPLESYISLSGDNSCSFETVRIAAQHVKHIALAVLDAHPDACGPNHDPHANWVWRLWQLGVVAPEKTIFFGIRDPEEEEMRYIKEKNAMVITPDEIDAFLLSGNKIFTQCLNKWRPFPDHALIIVVDIDVLDPAYAPGTGMLRAGGLNVRQVLNIIRRLCALPFAMRIGEICEVIPQEGNTLRPQRDQRPDPCGLTVLAAEAILRQMIQSMKP